MTVYADIRTLVPHAGPMVLLDRVISASSDSLCAEVMIRDDSMFAQAGSVGAWVGIEYMAQAIAAHAGLQARLDNNPVKIGFLLGTRRYQSHCDSFAVGSILHVHVQLDFLDDSGLASFTCRILHNEQSLATANMTVFQPENAEPFLLGNV